MPNDTTRIEIVTGRERRRPYSGEQKLRLVEETMQPSMTVSVVARQHGMSPSLLFGWRRLMSEGGQVAVRAHEDVVAVSPAGELEQRVRELEPLLSRKTLEVEVLREALAATRRKKPAWRVASPLPDGSGEARRRNVRGCGLNLVEQIQGTPKPWGRYRRQVMTSSGPPSASSLTHRPPTATGGLPSC